MFVTTCLCTGLLLAGNSSLIPSYYFFLYKRGDESFLTQSHRLPAFVLLFDESYTVADTLNFAHQCIYIVLSCFTAAETGIILLQQKLIIDYSVPLCSFVLT